MCVSKVFKLCKSLLLEMASPDALIRLTSTQLLDEQRALCEIYMEEQHHSSLEAFVQSQIALPKCARGILMQVLCYVTSNDNLPSLVFVTGYDTQ